MGRNARYVFGEECTNWKIKRFVRAAWTEKLARENDLFLMDQIVKIYRNPSGLARIDDV